MQQEQILELIEKEFQEKTLYTTGQYLEILHPVYANNRLKIERIDEEEEEVIVVYIPVQDEKFYFAIYIDPKSREVFNVGTEAGISVYFRADSDQFSLDDLQKMIHLPATRGRSMGDHRIKDIVWKESTIFFEPNPEPDEFEDKLKKLLSFLEQDTEGTKRIVEQAGGYIQVAIEIHNANGMIGGPHIDKSTIARMSTLGLSIDFDLYVGGHGFKD